MRQGKGTASSTTTRPVRPFLTLLRGLVLALPLGGCWLTEKLPEPALDIPEAYRLGTHNPRQAHAALPKLDWWRGFRSRELTSIVEHARDANLDIAAAVARIVQADAQARVTGASVLPTIDFSGSATRTRSSGTTSSGSSSGGSESDSLIGRLTASYEIDFWGKNRSALRAAEESAVASRFNKEVVALSTMATAANAYFQVLAAQDRLEAARKNLRSANRVLGLIRQRLEAGTTSNLEVSQQESVVNTLRAAIPPLQQTLTQNRNALAVLMARPPQRVRIRGDSLNNIRIPRVTPGLPSELLAQRPDIREAEARLAAAGANVMNARAQFLPSITLTGSGGYQSAMLSALLRPESAIYSVAASVAQPIFEAGRLSGNLDLQEGKHEELLQNYRKAVISAFSDVETALDAIRQTALRERLQREVVASSRTAFEISEQRFQQGTIDLINMLQTQQTLYQAEDTLIQARLAHLQAIVSLYQALGGGWLPKPPPEPQTPR